MDDDDAAGKINYEFDRYKASPTPTTSKRNCCRQADRFTHWVQIWVVFVYRALLTYFLCEHAQNERKEENDGDDEKKEKKCCLPSFDEFCDHCAITNDDLRVRFHSNNNRVYCKYSCNSHASWLADKTASSLFKILLLRTIHRCFLCPMVIGHTSIRFERECACVCARSRVLSACSGVRCDSEARVHSTVDYKKVHDHLIRIFE